MGATTRTDTRTDERARPSLPPVRTFELRTLGMRTRVLESGRSGNDEAVVFLHGAPGTANDWDRLLPRVGEFARAVAFDLPGWGESEKPSTWPYSADAYATFVAAAFDDLGIRRAHLVMGDIGASGGLLWAASHRDAFRSAIMLGAGILINFRWHFAGRMHRTPMLGDAAIRVGHLSFPWFMRMYEPDLPKEHLHRMRSGLGWETRRSMLRYWRAERRRDAALSGSDRSFAS